DLVHAHLSEIWVDRALSGLKKEIPWIATVHNDDRDDPWLRHKARGFALRHAKTVTCVSRSVATYVKKEFRIPSSHLSIIRNGIDLSRVTKRRPVEFHDPWRLISVGRLAKQKDQATLLKAVARLPFRWSLDLLGQGEERDALESLARILGIADRVHFRGLVDDVSERLAQADVFCFPSRWEGQGIALLEAAAANLPVLASDLPVFRESFDVSSMSFAAPHDPLAWSRALLFMRKNQKEALKKAMLAEKIVKKELTIKQMVDGYVRLYKTLI
ncbi:MAG: glycosyltransferase, partial [bacterium]|nr:glycosyltransferase [bacterium]